MLQVFLLHIKKKIKKDFLIWNLCVLLNHDSNEAISKLPKTMKNQERLTYLLQTKPLITNAIDAESVTRELCILINGKHNSQWCNDFFTMNFPRLLKTKMSKLLLGQAEKTQAYYYEPNKF
jgi:hypothetical protein